MQDDDLGTLRAYGGWLARHLRDEVVLEGARRLRAALPWYVRLFPDDAAYEARVAEILDGILADFAGGRAFERSLASMRAWARGENPRVDRAHGDPVDAIAAWAAHRQTLMHFVARYTSDAARAVALCEALDRHYTRIQRAAIEIVTRVHDERLHELGTEVAREKGLLESIVDHVPAAILLVDADGRIRWANPHAATWLGLPPGALAGRPLSDVTGHEPSQAYREAVVTGRPAGATALPIPREDETGYWDVVYAPMPTAGDEHGGVLVMAVNVDARVAAAHGEEARARKLADLERMKRGFVSAVSHELRTPLTTILGFAELLKEGAGGPLGDQAVSLVEEIGVAGRRLAGMVDDLLELGRVEAGPAKLALAPLDLRDVAREAVEAFRPEARRARVRLELELPPAPVGVTADRRRIAQVVADLLGNAIKFSPPEGRVVVRLSAEAHAAETGYRDGGAMLEVTDQGPGIAEADLPKLFKRFGQLPEGERRGGTGLGLAIAKQLVEAHAGHVGVLSAPGKGSTFWFTLPLGRPAVEVVTPEEAPRRLRG